MTDTSDAQSIIDFAVDHPKPHPIDEGRLYVALIADSEGKRFQTLDTATFGPHPRRKGGTVRLADVESFAAYVTDHYEAGASRVYADGPANEITAVLNDHHTNSAAGWGDHRATLVVPFTDEWSHWRTPDRMWLTHDGLAERIADHPDTIDAGQADADAVAVAIATFPTKGPRATLPPFKVRMSVYPDSTVETLPVRLITKPGHPADGDKPESLPMIRYLLDRPDRAARSAFAALVDDVRQALPHVPVLLGIPRP